MPLSIKELRDAVIADGIAEIKRVGYAAHKERGAIAGMEMCRDLLTLPQYRRAIAERTVWEISWRNQNGDITQYWEHVMATRQVEFVYEVLRVAYNDAGSYSGNAVRCYVKYMQPEDYQAVFGKHA